MLVKGWRLPRPPVVDVAVAAAFVLFGQLVIWTQLEGGGYAGPRATNAVLNALALSALAWRRTAPLAAVMWAVAVYFLPHLLTPLDASFWAGAVPLNVLSASAAYFCPRPRALVAGAFTFAGLLAVSLATPELRSLDAIVWNTVFLLVPWLGARALRERGDRSARLAASLTAERASKREALQQAAATERARIARELHDIVAHNVSMMVIQVGAARMQLQSGAAAAEDPLLAAEEVGRQTLDDLRRLLGVLRADTDDSHPDTPAGQPLPPQPGLMQLESLVTPVRQAGMPVDVVVEGQPLHLPPALDLTAYRIVQEGLTNALKHSGATQVIVTLTYAAAALAIEITDDGTAPPAAAGSGHGLVGIRERVSMFGGAVSAGPSPTGGWRVRAELPIVSDPDHSGTAVPAS